MLLLLENIAVVSITKGINSFFFRSVVVYLFEKSLPINKPTSIFASLLCCGGSLVLFAFVIDGICPAVPLFY